MARSRHSIEQKLSALHMMEEETYTWKEIKESHHVSENTLRLRKVKFETGGIDALKELRIWKLYTKEQKISAVRNYLDGFTIVKSSPDIKSVVIRFYIDGSRGILVIAS